MRPVVNSVPALRVFSAAAFWLIACVLLFWGLGATGLWNSEDRWIEIAREMRLSGNYFRPTINGVLYFDKPLLSYWLLAAFSFLTGGVNEWSLRLPSALSGLLTLWATVQLGSRLWSPAVGRLAGWLLLTSYGLLMWARLGEADMENLAVTIVAVYWYWRSRDSRGFWPYCVFYLIIFIGAQAKGLTAVVVPLLAILPDLLRGGRWRTHLNIAHVCAGAVGAAFYLLPFLLAESPRLGSSADTGLWLVFRENVVRYFAPFDHDEPFYTYFYAVPLLFLPWLPLLLAGLASALRQRRAEAANTGWLWWAFVLIFVFFTLSGSRRNYYILPILPYCALLAAVFLARAEAGAWRRIALIAQALVLLLFIVADAALPLLAPLFERRFGAPPPASLRLWAGAVFAAAALLWWWAARRFDAQLAARLGIPRGLAALLGVAVIVMGGFFLQQRAAIDSVRSERPFALALKPLLAGVPAAQIVTYRDRLPGDTAYYANIPVGVRRVDAAAELLQFAQTPPYPKWVLCYDDLVAELPPELRARAPTLAQQRHPWDDKHEEVLQAWRLDRAP
jgi:4-amino-4-deoxy-L-arabinose transferase-like glycosyltransferase